MADWELRVSGLGALAVLPDHLLNMIFLLLPVPDVVSLSSVSRPLRVICCEEPLWQQLCLRLPVDLEKLVFQANWRQTALGLLAKHPEACWAKTSGQDLADPGASTGPSAQTAVVTNKLRIPPPSSIQAAARPPAPVPLQSDFLYRRWYRCNMKLSGFLPEQQLVQRISAENLTPQDFMAAWDAPCLPVVLTHAMDPWPKDHDWTFPGLAKTYADCAFHVSLPGAATGSCSMTMQHYWDYVQRQADEEPLYVFDPGFAYAAPPLLQAYQIPRTFTQDYFSVLEREWRPQFQWLVAGPAKSGASWHIDPKLTSAWNALCSGRKRWALYPPHVPPPGVALIETEPGTLSTDDAYTSLQWYMEVYPTLSPEQRPIEFVQEPGDVVFVPGGWWHMVLNLEDSVAVTQNFVSDANLERVVSYMSNGSFHYYNNLEQYYSPAQMALWDAIKPYKVAGASEEGSDSGSWEEEVEGDQARSSSDADDALSDASNQQESDDEYHELGIWPEEITLGSSGPTAGPATGTHASSNGTYELKCLHAKAVLHPTTAADNSSLEDTIDSNSNGQSETRSDAHNSCEPTPWPATSGLPAPTMQRDRLLGRWLRGLLLQQPHLAKPVQSAARRHAGLDHWRTVLSAIKSATQGTHTLDGLAVAADNGGASEPAVVAKMMESLSFQGVQDDAPTEQQLLELLPYVGSASMVFIQGGGTAIKLILEQPKSIAGLMCVLEVHVPHMLGLAPAHMATAATNAAPLHAAVQSHGVLEVCWPREHDNSNSSSAATADNTQPVKPSAPQSVADPAGTEPAQGRSLFPFVCLQSVGFNDGWQTLVKTWPDLPPMSKVSAAQGLGRMMAALHVRGHIAAVEHVNRSRPAADTTPNGTSPALTTQNIMPRVDMAADTCPHWQHVISSGQTWWHDRIGNAWTSHQGHVVKSELLPPRKPAAGLPMPAPSSPAWAPFVEFLRSRRSEARMALKYIAELPEWLLQQVDVYLPADPVVLVSSSGSGSGSNPVPVLLHGDVTLNNVLYTRPGNAAAAPPPAPEPQHSTAASGTAAQGAESGTGVDGTSDESGQEAAGAHGKVPRTRFLLLDWADAGFGDPLYEIMALNASIFLHDPDLLACFWVAYKQQLTAEAAALREAQGEPWVAGSARAAAAARLAQCSSGSEVLQVMWPRRGELPVSKVAMCYSLLYEEPDMVGKLWARHGGKAQGSGQADGLVPGVECASPVGELTRLASIVWGALDE